MKTAIILCLILILVIPQIPLVRGDPYSMECEVIILKVIDIDTFELKIKNYAEINKEQKFSTAVPGLALEETEILKLDMQITESNEILKGKITEEMKRSYEGKEAVAVINYFYKPKYEGYMVVRDEDGALVGSLIMNDRSVIEDLEDIESILEGLRGFGGITDVLRELRSILGEMDRLVQEMSGWMQEIRAYLYRILEAIKKIT